MAQTTSPRITIPTDLSEQDLLQALVQRGFVTPSEVQDAQAARLREARQDIYRPVLEHLLDLNALTVAQAERIVDECVNASRVDDLPGYRLLEQLGSGSMGTVHRALQLGLNRVVAVKILSRRFARNRHYVESFARECQFAAMTSSPHFPRVFDAGMARGQHYLVMEFIEGHSIDSLLCNGRHLTELQMLHVAAEVCKALDHLHAVGVIHRDVKPDNIVIGRDDELKLLDLGLAKRIGDEAQVDAERGAAIGTPHYISPEQACGSRYIDGRSDLYCLGASMFHMLTGRPPFVDGKTNDVFEAHLHQPVPRPSSIVSEISPAVEQLVLRFLEKLPDERPATASEAEREIRQTIATFPSAPMGLQARLGF